MYLDYTMQERIVKRQDALCFVLSPCKILSGNAGYTITDKSDNKLA